jgi:hypothetical protein
MCNGWQQRHETLSGSLTHTHNRTLAHSHTHLLGWRALDSPSSPPPSSRVDMLFVLTSQCVRCSRPHGNGASGCRNRGAPPHCVHTMSLSLEHYEPKLELSKVVKFPHPHVTGWSGTLSFRFWQTCASSDERCLCTEVGCGGTPPRHGHAKVSRPRWTA